MFKKFQVDLQGKSPEVLSDQLTADFVDVAISWCDDGTAVISTEGATDAEIEAVMANRGLRLKETCRQDIKHRVDPATKKEPAHEILERIPVKELKKTTVN